MKRLFAKFVSTERGVNVLNLFQLLYFVIMDVGKSNADKTTEITFE